MNSIELKQNEIKIHLLMYLHIYTFAYMGMTIVLINWFVLYPTTKQRYLKSGKKIPLTKNSDPKYRLESFFRARNLQISESLPKPGPKTKSRQIMTFVKNNLGII